MIKGVVYNYDYRFGEAVNHLISFLTNVNLRYKKKGSSDVDFKGFKNIKLFEERLESIYKNTINEIDESLLIDYKKYDRLTYVSNLIIKISEVKGLFSEEPKIGLKYNFFKLYISSKFKKKELAYQEYCVIINDYLSRFLLYLNEKKELHSNLNDLDLPKEELNDWERYKSTQEDPICFFKRLLTQPGFRSIYESFKPAKEDFHRQDIEYCDKTKTITYNIFNIDEEGSSYTFKSITFKDYILRSLKQEAHKALFLVRAKFEVSGTEDEFIFYLKRIIACLKDLINKQGKIEEEYFEIIKEQVNKLIKQLQQKYKSYLKEIKEETKCFFKLKGDKSELRDKAIDLHTRLCKHGFLKQETKKMFVDLFIGKTISEKIIWSGKRNQLKLFVDLLVEQKKIKGTVRGKNSCTSSNFILPKELILDNFFSNTKPPVNKSIMIEIVSKV